MEQRRMLTADPLLVGGVYTETDVGDDAHGDSFEISFAGGAPGTQLTRVVIDGDQVGNFQNVPGLSSGDVFFDTAPGGRGVDNSFPFSLISVVDAQGQSKTGVTATASVLDGGTLLAIDLRGMVAGDVLTFTIDVDEAEIVDPRMSIEEQNQLFDPLTSGAEFHGSLFTAHFSAPHYHDSQAAGTFANFYDAKAAAASQQAGGVSLALPTDSGRGNPDRTAGAFANVEQTPLPITIAGTVYHDRNRDLQQDVTQGEEGIGGVTIELWKLGNNGQYAPALSSAGNPVTTQTDLNGDYEFDESWNLLPGTYELREQQPVAYTISVGAVAGTVEGNAVGATSDTNTLTGVQVLLGGQHAMDYDFGEANPAAISGFVYHDRNDNGIREPNLAEEAIAGVAIELHASSGQVVASTTTDADGFYEFTNLLPDTYSVFEVQPDGWIDGKDTLGSVATSAGPTLQGTATDDALLSIELLSGDVGTNYNFGERLGSLAGRVHVDLDEDCLQDPGEQSLQGVLITLQNQSGQTWTTTTDANGEYRFDDLLAGTYTVIESQPTGYFNGRQSVGSGSGQSDAANQISGIAIDASHLDLVDYNFCEHVGSISGFVYHDRDNDGLREPTEGEEAISAVEVTLLDDQGQQVATTVTDVDGFYSFDSLAPGTYTVVESQPDRWIDGKDTVGTLGGAVTNDRQDAIVLPQDAVDPAQRHGERYNFGERQGSLEGFVFSDPNHDCVMNQGDSPIANVSITLVDQTGQQWTTTTDADGRYRFEDLMAGDYTVIQNQPASFFSGGQVVGNGTGDPSVSNRISAIEIGADLTDLVDYNFCEHLGAISGYVYHDRDDDGIREPNQSEEAIAGVELILLDSQGNAVGTTTTDVDGYYQFTSLGPDVYAVIESQPSGWLDGKDTPGAVDGQAVGTANGNDHLQGIDLTAGSQGVQYNFGELLPGSIAGQVHTDLNLNCVFEPGTLGPAGQPEIALPGVSVELYDGDGNLLATTTTDADGNYRFDGLRPGEYQVVEIQPLDLFSVGEVIGDGTGSVAGANHLSGIQVGSGEHFSGYNFCEAPAATLSGYVFQDGPVIITQDGSVPTNLAQIRDGLLTPDDAPIAGVVLELRSGLNGAPIDAADALPGYHPPGPLRATTDANGFYEFKGLPRGNYAVYQVHPDGYVDSLDTAGTTSGLPNNINAPLPQTTLFRFAAHPLPAFDSIIFIPLAYGQSSELNNFSEVRAQPQVPPPPPEDPPGRETPPDPVTPPLVAQPLLAGPPPAPGARIPIYGGAGLVDVSWHLSIIDAGAARGDGTAHSTLWIREGSDEVWRRNALREAQWVLSSSSDSQTPVSFEYLFGSYDAIPVTGDFDGNGVSEIGVYIGGDWFLDLNGNGHWDEDDLWLQLGTSADQPVTGDWDGDGKDDIGIFGPMWAGDPRQIIHDPGLPDVDNAQITDPKNIPPTPEVATNGHRLMQKSVEGDVRADLIDHVFYYGKSGDVAIAGDWNGDGIDNIGLYREGLWILDTNGDGRLDQQDAQFTMGEPGDRPIVMDTNGDGIDELGVYRLGEIWVDIDHDRELDAHDALFELEGEADHIFAGDFDGDGTDEAGRYRAFADDRQADSDDTLSR